MPVSHQVLLSRLGSPVNNVGAWGHHAEVIINDAIQCDVLQVGYGLVLSIDDNATFTGSDNVLYQIRMCSGGNGFYEIVAISPLHCYVLDSDVPGLDEELGVYTFAEIKNYTLQNVKLPGWNISCETFGDDIRLYATRYDSTDDEPTHEDDGVVWVDVHSDKFFTTIATRVHTIPPGYPTSEDADGDYADNAEGTDTTVEDGGDIPPHVFTNETQQLMTTKMTVVESHNWNGKTAIVIIPSDDNTTTAYVKDVDGGQIGVVIAPRHLITFENDANRVYATAMIPFAMATNLFTSMNLLKG
jgi:hypothetical protein